MLKKLTGRKKNRISSSDADLLRKKSSKEVDRWMIDNGYMYRCADGTYKPKRGSCYARWEYEKKLLKGDTENDRFRTMNSMRSVDAQAGIYLLGR